MNKKLICDLKMEVWLREKFGRLACFPFVLLISLLFLSLFALCMKKVIVKDRNFLTPFHISSRAQLLHNFSVCKQEYCSFGGDEVKLFAKPLALHKNRDYIIHIAIKDITGPIILYVDLYAGSKYDFAAQEKSFYITRSNTELFVHLNSGSKAPKEALLRIFFKSKNNIILNRPQIYTFNATGIFLFRAVYYVIFFLFLLFIIFLFIFDRTKHKVFFHSLFFVFLLFLFFRFFCINAFDSGDTFLNVPTSLSILSEANLDLDEFQDIIPDSWRYAQIKIDEHYYINFPVGLPILITPIIFLLRFFYSSIFELQHYSSLIIYLSLSFLFFITTYVLTNRIFLSYLLAFIFSLCTTNATTISTSLWTHGGIELMLVATLLLILVGEKRRNYCFILFAAFPLAFSYIIRPTASIFIVSLLLYIFIKHRQLLIPFVFLMSFVFSIFVIISLINYGSFLPPYYLASRLSLNTFLEALFGQSFSPNRGFFVWQPIFLFSIYGIYRYIKEKNILMTCLALGTFGFFLILAMFPHWWGGFSYGPRLFTDILPFMVLFLIPFCQDFILQKRDKFFKRFFWISIFTALCFFCLFVQMRAWRDIRPLLWNAYPRNVDQYPERLWDWHDIQFLRGLNIL